MTPAVRFTNVSKRYRLGATRTSVPEALARWAKRVARRADGTPSRRDHWALRDVSFDLHHGQSLALVGPNGAGKSTLLKLLAKVTEPTAGRIAVNRRVSALIELGAGFHPDLTGRENVYLNGAILGIPRPQIERRFDRIVAFAELDEFIDTPLKRYSSGMAVRLGFAVASSMDPEILLVDEVLAVGDASFQRKCIDRIRELQQQGTTLIFVSHNLGLVKAVCSSALLLADGGIAAEGTVPFVVDRYNELLDARRSATLERPAAGGTPAAGVEIAQVEVLAESGQPADGQISSRSAVVIRVWYVAYRRFERAEGLVRIYRSDGTSCCVMRMTDDGARLSVKEGRGSFTVTLDPVQLAGGTYHAVAWVLDDTGVNGMARGTSDWFRVKGVVGGREADDAVFEPARRWSVREPATAASAVTAPARAIRPEGPVESE